MQAPRPLLSFVWRSGLANFAWAGLNFSASASNVTGITAVSHHAQLEKKEVLKTNLLKETLIDKGSKEDGQEIRFQVQDQVGPWAPSAQVFPVKMPVCRKQKLPTSWSPQFSMKTRVFQAIQDKQCHQCSWCGRIGLHTLNPGPIPLRLPLPLSPSASPVFPGHLN
jgi:hypothetical protein